MLVLFLPHKQQRVKMWTYSVCPTLEQDREITSTSGHDGMERFKDMQITMFAFRFKFRGPQHSTAYFLYLPALSTPD